ncbi:hypothetical protein Tco_1312794 [Tanacetum coccineum]
MLLIYDVPSLDPYSAAIHFGGVTEVTSDLAFSKSSLRLCKVPLLSQKTSDEDEVTNDLAYTLLLEFSDTVMSDFEDSTNTYTEVILQASPSPNYVPGLEEPEQEPPLPDFVLELVYLEFMPPEDKVFPAEEQPLPAIVSPIADSPGYVPESDSEEDPEEDPADYPVDGGDDGDING